MSNPFFVGSFSTFSFHILNSVNQLLSQKLDGISIFIEEIFRLNFPPSQIF